MGASSLLRDKKQRRLYLIREKQVMIPAFRTIPSQGFHLMEHPMDGS